MLHTCCDLDQVCHAHVVLFGHGAKGLADGTQLRILATGVALVAQDDGAVAGPCPAIVEGQTDGLPGVAVAVSKGVLEFAGHGVPDVWTAIRLGHAGGEEGGEEE